MKRIIGATLLAVGLLISGCGQPQKLPPFAHTPLSLSSSATTAGATTTATIPTSGVCHSSAGKADRRCTPGITNPAVTQANISSTICVTGWTKTIRPPVSYTNSLKARQMREYGLTGAPATVEEDHLIPLEIGGNPTNDRNLWPELWNGTEGAHTKDHEENALHHAVCSHSMTLAAAQAKILGDWTS